MFGRLVIIVLLYLVKFRRCYEIPEASFERLPLGGIRVSIPDEPGVQFFAFHANVNDQIGTNEVGTITGEVIRSRDNRWTFEDKKVSFRENDVLYYWIYVQANGIPYTRSGQEGIAINDRVSKGGVSECEKSITSVRGKVAACRGHLVFEETFEREIDGEDSSTAKASSWTREIIVPMDPDYEFCVYRELPNNLQFNNGTLAIVPLILDEVHGGNATFFGRLDLSESCTGSVPLECNRRAIGHSILPPVISARLTTKESFHFRYGKIEIRAKFPQGDWLYPEIWLEPQHHSYGAGYSSGRIMLGLARGNQHLASTSSTDTVQYGGRLLEFGLRTGPRKDVRENKVTKMRSLGTWSDDFHVYTTIWDEGGFRFWVDGEDVGRIEVGAWSDQNRNAQNSTGTNDSMAPYDQEFYITAGLGVGGIRVFPDGTTSGRNPKPWRNVEAKAMLNFWLAKEKWLPSWRGRNGNENSQFKLDYLRVWAV